MHNRFIRVLAPLASLLLMVPGASLAAAAATSTVPVPANQPWTDTGIAVKAGDSVSITATGTVFVAGSDGGRRPEGARGCTATAGRSVPPSPFLAPGLTCWSLVGRISNTVPFGVGAATTIKAEASGRVFLGINDNDFEDNRGSWTADVTVTRQKGSDENRDDGIRSEVSSTNGWQLARFRVERDVPFAIQFISGSWTVDTRNFPSVGPQGYQRQIDREIFQGCKVDNRRPYATLLARVGDSGSAFAVGRGGQFRSPDGGRLFLRINDADRCLGDNEGSVIVNLRQTQGQSLKPPRITRVETYREGGLVYLRAFFTDPNGDAKGFGFRGANGSGWAEESHPFSNPSYGRVGPGRVDYPFNLGCGTSRDYETDVEFWIYDATGLRSESKVHHLTCGT